jgi:glycosyltransferase involved in cell wall biosynthesis
MNLQPKILWVGGIFNQNILMNHFAVSPAANRWQSGLIGGLKEYDFTVECLSHLPEPLWPVGVLRPGNKNIFDERFFSTYVPYWNIPFIRSFCLNAAYLTAFKLWCKENGPPKILITYNPTPYAVKVGRYAQLKFGTCWVDLCADHYDPGDDWSSYSNGAHLADGHIFLSFKAYMDCPFNKKLHLDGGVENLSVSNFQLCQKESAKSKKVILYSGMMSKWGGISYLLRAFERISDPSIELWVTGHGESSELQKAASVDSRIKVHGLVRESKLEELYRRADVFINPRPSSIPGNSMNFPSKLLVYLSYGKPVVSTWTPGLGNEYRDVLEIVDIETVEYLKDKIEEVLCWSPNQIELNAQKIFNFLSTKKLWKIQSMRLVEWLTKDIFDGI